jgi:CRP/FNR family transcriptional regulator, cyclic AMP receptor protein
MPADFDILKRMPYFLGLTESELETVRSSILEKTAARSDVLILEGDSGKALFFLISGALKVFKTSADGKEQILNILRPGESFNDVPVFDGVASPVSVQALGPAVIYEIGKTELETLMKRYPLIARNIINVLAARTRQLVSLVEDLSFRHVIGRVAKILLENVKESPSPGERLTQQDMAAMAGTAREVVGRSLKLLEDEGLIKLDRNRIVIRNKKALKERIGSSF